MEDSYIVALYWERSESAISETATKYGKYCYAIAYGILDSAEDAEESVNDTYLDAWNAMPPHRPALLKTFLGKITRRISIDRWRGNTAEKRGGGEVKLALHELEECVASDRTVEHAVEERELLQALNTFLGLCSVEERDLFICRYFFMLPVAELSEKFRYSPSKTKTMLYRTRKKLLHYLQKEGLL